MTTDPSTHPAAQSYRASGFGNRLGWGSKPALLLIDPCKAYFTPSSPLSLLSNPAAVESVDVMRRLVAAARSSSSVAEVPVIWTKVAYRDIEDEAGLFYSKCSVLEVFREDDERGFGGWLEGLEPQDGEEVVVKKFPSAFCKTELEGRLRGRGVDTIVVCGVSTSGCVRASVLDGLCAGFRPMIVGAGCGDRTKEIHEGNLFDMDSKMGDVVSQEEAMEHLKTGWAEM